MSFHYWRNVGRSAKRRFLTLSNSYHGETLGALAVGDVDLYKQIYRPLLMDVITVPSPDCYARAPGESWAQHSRRMFAHMEAALAQHAHEACAVIVEPLVQCAGGMRMYDPVYLTLLREACDRHQVHLIADEIAVGFGRTGSMFACEQAGIRPDFMCLSKGLTGGYLPLSTVMTTDGVYQAFTTSTSSSTPSCTRTASPATRWPAPQRAPVSPFSATTTCSSATGRSPRAWASAPARSRTTRTWRKCASGA